MSETIKRFVVVDSDTAVALWPMVPTAELVNASLSATPEGHVRAIHREDGTMALASPGAANTVRVYIVETGDMRAQPFAVVGGEVVE